MMQMVGPPSAKQDRAVVLSTGTESSARPERRVSQSNQTMKSNLPRLLLAALLLATLNPQLSTLHAQTSAFTYQGRLLEEGQPANGVYDFRFVLFPLFNAKFPVTDYVTNSAVAVSNGVFTTAVDFGAAVYSQPELWLQIAVRPNLPKPADFVIQTPRQQITSAPWAVRASTLPPGTVTATELADGAVTSPKLGAGAVTSAKIAAGTIVNADIAASAAIADTKLATISTSGKVANSATTAIAANTANAIVARDASGNFNAGTVTATAFSGGGSGLTGLNASQLGSGTVPDARLGGNVALRSGGNTFSGNQLVSSGNVGIGTTTPDSPLDVRGLATLQLAGVANHDNLRIKKTGALSSTNAEFVFSHRSTGTGLWLYGYNGSAYRNLQGWDYVNNIVRFPADGQDLFIDASLRRVGVGTASPLQRFHVVGSSRMDGSGSGMANPTLYVTNSAAGGIGICSVTSSSDANLVVVNKAGGDIMRAFSGPTGGNIVFQINNTGYVTCADELSCESLLIRGGADLAEPFPLSDDGVPAGAVMVIDTDQPGRLKLSTEAYDSKVAGIVSGAGGVQPGIVLTQTEVLEDGRNVALSGRVYALVDADCAPVQPGDLLTTSTTPGHAMKASDAGRRSGAVLGKAMTPLTTGRGLVLVLVSLQ
jgi:hypothetical protein